MDGNQPAYSFPFVFFCFIIFFYFRLLEDENDVDMIRGQFKWNALHSANKAIKFIVDPSLLFEDIT